MKDKDGNKFRYMKNGLKITYIKGFRYTNEFVNRMIAIGKKDRDPRHRLYLCVEHIDYVYNLIQDYNNPGFLEMIERKNMKRDGIKEKPEEIPTYYFTYDYLYYSIRYYLKSFSLDAGDTYGLNNLKYLNDNRWINLYFNKKRAYYDPKSENLIKEEDCYFLNYVCRKILRDSFDEQYDYLNNIYPMMHQSKLFCHDLVDLIFSYVDTILRVRDKDVALIISKFPKIINGDDNV